MSSPSKFATFSPYAPPPDDPQARLPAPSPSKFAARPWFPAHASSSHAIDTSYQSGGIPTFDTSLSGGQGAEEAETQQQNQWETRYGLRVDMLAAAAYLFGPVTALALLIGETQNDFVRFHAYQSALLTTPLVIVRIMVSLLQFPSWFRTFFTLSIISIQLFMAFRAFRDAAQNGLVRFELPIIGQKAAKWLAEE